MMEKHEIFAEKLRRGAYGLRCIQLLSKNLDSAALYIEHQQSEIQRLREELAKREWQPIETAPKDGTDVLIVTWHDGEPDIQSSWYNSTGMWWAGVGGDSPTHWMPLPDRPKEDA